MWLGALRAIAADPLTGSGIGGFGGAYADSGVQWLLPSANVTDNTYNELLTIGVEQSLLGMAAMAAVTLMAMLRLRRSCRPLILSKFHNLQYYLHNTIYYFKCLSFMPQMPYISKILITFAQQQFSNQ